MMSSDQAAGPHVRRLSNSHQPTEKGRRSKKRSDADAEDLPAEKRQAIPEPNTQEVQSGLQNSSAASAADGTRAVAAPAGAPPCTRVFVNADFAHTAYKDCHLTRKQFEEYKQRFLGKPVPPQDVSNDQLVALGYDLPEPWIQCCIEENMPNYT